MTLEDRTFHEPIEYYEELWEDLMDYTDYKDVSQIETQSDLNDWFSQLAQPGKDKGHAPTISHRFRQRMTEALQNLQRFKEAGGKDLQKDRETTANVTDSSAEYKKVGAQHSDLRGLDTKDAGKRNYSIPSTQKRKGITISTYANYDGRYYRDSKGRFAKVMRR